MSKIFNQIIFPSSDKMYRYAFSILKNKENAEDVVQECLMKIWNKRKLLPKIVHPEAWALRIIRNQCYDWIKLNRYELVDNDNVTLLHKENKENQMVTENQMEWLNKILNLMPETHQQIFHLREIEEMTYQEISEIMGLSLSNVKINIHRIRQKIKTELTKLNTYGVNQAK